MNPPLSPYQTIYDLTDDFWDVIVRLDRGDEHLYLPTGLSEAYITPSDDIRHINISIARSLLFKLHAAVNSLETHKS